MNQNKKKNRTEGILSVIIATALVLTLTLTVVNNIRKKENPKENIVDLNETQAPLLEHETMDAQEVPTKPGPLQAKASEPPTEAPSLNAEAQTEATEEHPSPAAPENIAVDAVDSVTTNLSFNENTCLYWPVTGDILLGYNMENTIWFPTLGQYQCNPEIYISSPVGTTISSACTGVVEAITENEVTGTNITLAVGNDYKITYGSVDQPTVVKGDLVQVGDSIGRIATPTIYYATEGSGLHFSITHKDEPVDPMEFLY